MSLESSCCTPSPAGYGEPDPDPAYFSQPILEGDRSLCSSVPSPLVPSQWAQSANSLGKWRSRQDSNLRPSASKAGCLIGYTKRLYPLGDSRSRFAGIGRLFGHLRRFIASLPITVPIALLLSGHAEPTV